jgi:hypothetical protein
MKCFWKIWNCQSVDRRKSEKFHRDLKVVQSVPVGVLEEHGLKEFWSNGD